MERVIYVKYSNDRDNKFQICTKLMDGDNGKYIIKTPQSHSAKEHVQGIYNNYHRLCKVLSGLSENSIGVAGCCKDEHGVILEYVEGESLQNILCKCYFNREYDKFYEYVHWYVELVKECACVDFVVTDDFVKIFGACDLSEQKSMLYSNVDFNFDNIIVGENRYIIDYEWIFDFPMPVGYILYRALVYLCISLSSVGKDTDELLLDICSKCGLSFSAEEVITYKSMENHFHCYTQGNHNTLNILQQCIGGEKHSFHKMAYQLISYEKHYDFEYYYNYGSGDTEGGKLHVEPNEQNEIEISLDVPSGAEIIRLDPGSESCVVKLLECNCNVESNGKVYSDAYFLFNHNDPQLYLNVHNLAKVYLKILILFAEAKEIDEIIDIEERKRQIFENKSLELANEISVAKEKQQTIEELHAHLKDSQMDNERLLGALNIVGIENPKSEISFQDMSLEINGKRVYLSELKTLQEEKDKNYSITVFFNKGNKDEKVGNYTVYPNEDGVVSFGMDVLSEIQVVRIDAGECSCIIQIIGNHEELTTNGIKINQFLYLFPNGDPQIYCSVKQNSMRRLEIQYRLLPLNMQVVNERNHESIQIFTDISDRSIEDAIQQYISNYHLYDIWIGDNLSTLSCVHAEPTRDSNRITIKLSNDNLNRPIFVKWPKECIVTWYKNNGTVVSHNGYYIGNDVYCFNNDEPIMEVITDVRLSNEWIFEVDYAQKKSIDLLIENSKMKNPWYRIKKRIRHV